MSILDEVAAVREQQITKGYDAAHDDAHGAGHLVAIAGAYVDRHDREGLVVAAALLVAAIEAVDRQDAKLEEEGE